MKSPDKINVLIAILKYLPDYTGAGIVAHQLFQNLKKKGVGQVSVIATSLEPRERLTEIDGIKVHWVGVNRYVEKAGSFKILFLKIGFVLSSIFAAIKTYFQIYRDYDLVYAIGSCWLSSTISFCARLTQKPVIKQIVLMGADDPITLRKKPVFVRPFFLLPFKWARWIMTISPPLKESCLQAGIPQNKIWLCYSPIYFNDEKSPISKPFLYKKLDISKRKILWVGTVSPRKDVEFLVRAGFYLEGEVQLVFVGPQSDAEYFKRVSDLAARMQADTGGRITAVFPGRTDNRKELRALYEACDAFWFASRFEGLGNVVLETLLCGTPAITLPINGIMLHLIVDPIDGEVVDTSDPKVFAECMNRHLRDYARLHDRQRLKVRSAGRFDAEKIEDDHIARFNAVLRNRKNPLKGLPARN